MVRSDHSEVEGVESDLDESGVSDPSSVVSSSTFSSLVCLDLGDSGVVLGFVVLDGNLSRHSSHSVNSTSTIHTLSARVKGEGRREQTCDRS